MKEIHLQRAIVEALNYSGCKVWRVNVGMFAIGEGRHKRMFRSGQAGQADIQGIRKADGKFIGLEVKLPTRRKAATDLQKQFIQDIKDAKGISGIVTSVDEALALVST